MAELDTEAQWHHHQIELAGRFARCLQTMDLVRTLPPGDEMRLPIDPDRAAMLYQGLCLTDIGRLMLPVGTPLYDGPLICDYYGLNVCGVIDSVRVKARPDEASVELLSNPNSGGLRYAGFRFEYAYGGKLGIQKQIGAQIIGIAVNQRGLPTLVRDVEWNNEQQLHMIRGSAATDEDVNVLLGFMTDHL